MNLRTIDDLIVALQDELGNVENLKEAVTNEIEEKIEEYAYDNNYYKMTSLDEDELNEIYECVRKYDKNHTHYEVIGRNFQSFSIDSKIFYADLEETEKERIFKRVLEKYSKK